MSSELNNDGLTLKYKVDDGTWATLDTTISIGDSLDSIRYSTWTPEYEKEEKGEERIDNMNILEYYERTKRAEIASKYESIIEEEYNKLEVVNAYNTLVNEFEINLKQLADKYNTKDETFIERTGYEADYVFELNDNIECNIREKHSKDYDKEVEELSKFVEEVRAVLSLSEDKDYQLDVLKNYEILDKKGMLNI